MSITNSEEVKQIVQTSVQQLKSCKTIDDLRRVSDDISSRVRGRGTKRSQHTAANLDRELKNVQRAIRGKFSPKLRSKTSSMKVMVALPFPELEVFAALVGKDASTLVKKGAYYQTEEIMPVNLLPGVFDPYLPEKKRFRYNSIDPDSGFVRSTNGYPKTMNTSKACELRYKPSTRELSVTAWNIEISSWEECCKGNPGI